MDILDVGPGGSGNLDPISLTIGLIIAFGSIIICLMHFFGIYF